MGKKEPWAILLPLSLGSQLLDQLGENASSMSVFPHRNHVPTAGSKEHVGRSEKAIDALAPDLSRQIFRGDYQKNPDAESGNL